MQPLERTIDHDAAPIEWGLRRDDESGSALVMVVITVLLIMVFSAVTMTVVTTHGREHKSSFEHLRCLYLAETAIERANLELNRGGTGDLGSEGAYMPLGPGEVWVTATVDDADNVTLVARARINDVTQTVTAISAPSNYVFDHAIFAGNSSDDPDYSLDFSGSGSEADEINGDVYSGQDVERRDDATISGEVRAAGIGIGLTAQEGVTQPLPDISSMAYHSNNDVDVAAEFAANQTHQENAAGGNAFQVPESNPAHIFRRNPTDRMPDAASNTKDDYFLEDPYEPVATDDNQDGSNAYQITFDTDGATAPGHEIVYYIDGNLWIHNLYSFSFQLAPTVSGTRVTFAVAGNIYISDNLFYGNADLDGIALIAINDPAVPDSGNIYFGDARYGTLDQMNAFMYAENNFYDSNLSASGSSEIVLNGTMSAGNQVLIDRDYDSHHARLVVNYDARLENGEINIPGLPAHGAYSLNYTILSWRRENGAME